MLKQSLTYIIYNNVKTITILHILKIIGVSVCILKSLYIGTLVRNENLHFLSILFYKHYAEEVGASKSYRHCSVLFAIIFFSADKCLRPGILNLDCHNVKWQVCLRYLKV